MVSFLSLPLRTDFPLNYNPCFPVCQRNFFMLKVKHCEGYTDKMLNLRVLACVCVYICVYFCVHVWGMCDHVCLCICVSMFIHVWSAHIVSVGLGKVDLGQHLQLLSPVIF